MLSCAFDEGRTPPDLLACRLERSAIPTPGRFVHHLGNCARDYYPSEEIAKARSTHLSPSIPFQVDNQITHSGTQSANSSTGAPLSELSANGTPPANYTPLRTSHERRESQATSLSTSPEHLRHTHRSNPNLSAFGTPFSRTFSFTNSVASSPPSAFPKKRLSPAGSYLGTSTSATTWSPSQFFSRSSTITEDLKSSFTLSVSDAEENVQRGPNRLAFATRLKNQHQFQNDGYAQVPLLGARQQKYFHYRQAYAHLLYIWGLPIARAESLKYNHVSTLESAATAIKPASLLSMGKPGQVDTHTNTEDQCLVLGDHCTSCAMILPYRSGTRRCQNCSTIQTPSICLLCNTFVQGLSSPCLNCGHVLHASCRELLISQAVDGVPLDCISGCGCICTDHSTVGMETPGPAADGSNKIIHKDVSPAQTIIGGTTANEQEQLGWYNNTEWEEMAYESLARNLQPRNEIKPKSSQIWRRRKGSNVTS